MSQFEEDREDYVFTQIAEAVRIYGEACHHEQQQRIAQTTAKRTARMKRWYWRAWYAALGW